MHWGYKMKKKIFVLAGICICAASGTLSYAASESIKSVGVINYVDEEHAVKFDYRDLEKIYTELEVISNETSGDMKIINNKITSYEEHCK